MNRIFYENYFNINTNSQTIYDQLIKELQFSIQTTNLSIYKLAKNTNICKETYTRIMNNPNYQIRMNTYISICHKLHLIPSEINLSLLLSLFKKRQTEMYISARQMAQINNFHPQHLSDVLNNNNNNANPYLKYLINISLSLKINFLELLKEENYYLIEDYLNSSIIPKVILENYNKEYSDRWDRDTILENQKKKKSIVLHYTSK